MKPLDTMLAKSALAYDAGYEAGRKAERELLKDQLFAQAARYPTSSENLIWNAVQQAFAEADRAEPAAPPAATEQPMTQDEIDDAHREAVKRAAGDCKQPEPARPLTLEARARAIMPNAVPSDLMTEHWTNTFTREVSNLCRDFAREALRAAIVIERPYVDRSDLCVSTAEVTCMMFPENRKPFLSVARENEAVAREQITDAVIAAAEKGEVPR